MLISCSVSTCQYSEKIKNIEADLGIFREIMENINGDQLA
jgi:hypothetical protein